MKRSSPTLTKIQEKVQGCPSNENLDLCHLASNLTIPTDTLLDMTLAYASRTFVCAFFCISASNAMLLAWMKLQAKRISNRRRALPGLAGWQQKEVKKASKAKQTKEFINKITTETVKQTINATSTGPLDHGPRIPF